MARKQCILLLVCAAALAAATAGRAARSAGWHTWWGSVSAAHGTYLLASQAPASPGETHSALLTSPALSGDLAFAYTATTLRQLRTGSAPNPWEVAWSMFRFRDLESYYWFILKPNGWELGKKQGSDRQIFLVTGSAPTLSVGQPNRIRIATSGARIRVSVDGAPVVDYLDPSPLPAGGSIGLYEEDSSVRFQDLTLTSDGYHL